MHPKWKQIAQENYDSLMDIEPSEANMNQYLLYAASVALLDHFATQGEAIHPEPKHAAQGENEGLRGVLLEYMTDELNDASKYIKLWQQTGNADFKGVAQDELGHFQILANYARTVDPNIDLNPYMVQHRAILAKL